MMQGTVFFSCWNFQNSSVASERALGMTVHFHDMFTPECGSFSSVNGFAQRDCELTSCKDAWPENCLSNLMAFVGENFTPSDEFMWKVAPRQIPRFSIVTCRRDVSMNPCVS